MWSSSAKSPARAAATWPRSGEATVRAAPVTLESLEFRAAAPFLVGEEQTEEQRVPPVMHEGETPLSRSLTFHLHAPGFNYITQSPSAFLINVKTSTSLRKVQVPSGAMRDGGKDPNQKKVSQVFTISCYQSMISAQFYFHSAVTTDPPGPSPQSC